MTREELHELVRMRDKILDMPDHIPAVDVRGDRVEIGVLRPYAQLTPTEAVQLAALLLSVASSADPHATWREFFTTELEAYGYEGP